MGQTFHLSVQLCDQIQAVKERIALQENVNVNQVFLSHQGKNLENFTTVQECKLTQGCTINFCNKAKDLS